MKFQITKTPVSRPQFRGIGVEADCCIFSPTNAANGVTEPDLQLIERRIRALRPGIARLFVAVGWFNPSLDGRTFDWTRIEYRQLLRQLQLLDAVGTHCNLVLFEPLLPAPSALPPLVDAMIALLERLRDAEAIRGIRWLTIYNEPDGNFLHDSRLSRAIFGERFGKQQLFPEYVHLNRYAAERLRERALYPAVRLAVADTVWGHPMRVERMQLCAAAFADLDVTFSYHQYAYDPCVPNPNPDYAFPGVAEEVRLFRQLLGADRELMVWEFNRAAPGFNSHYPGTGDHGTDLLGALDTGVAVSQKVLTFLAHGVDGVCLWCLHDVFYGDWPKLGPMRFGLWRYKWEQWQPRPYYHYYAALCNAFRPGQQIVRVEPVQADVTALAAVGADGLTVALLNPSAQPATITLQGDLPATFHRRRVYPAILPREGDLPVAETGTGAPRDNHLQLVLEPAELTILTG